MAFGADITLNGSGSTLSKPYQEVAIDQFKKTHKGVRINYGGGGSGKGRQDLADLVVNFAGSDSPFKAEDAAKAKGGALLYFPILLSPIAIIYNLDGVDKLQLSAPVIAKIFQRQITRWSDKAIAADNPGVKLPDSEIVVAHRADGSGTTQNFTEYLNSAAKGVWKLKSGSTVEWPSDTQAGQGSSGVAQIVKSTKGAIGYVDLSDAKASAAQVRQHQERGREIHRADPGRRLGRGRGNRGQGQPVVQRDRRQRRQGLSDHRPDLGHRLRQAARPGEGEALKAYLTFLVRMVRACSPRSTTRRCPQDCGTKPSSRSTRSTLP